MLSQNLENGQTSLAQAQRRALLETDRNLTQCLWDGAKCALQKNYVAKLPALLGTPSTDSAKALARAAARAAACANLTSAPSCLAAAASPGCSWEPLSGTCQLADVLDVQSLRGVAFCAGSRLDAAASCAALSGSGSGTAAACAASAYNCTALSSATSAAAAALAAAASDAADSLSGLGGLLGRLWEDVAAGVVASWADALHISLPSNWNASSLSGALSAAASALGGSASSAVNGTTVCVASWATDSAFLRSLSAGVLKRIASGQAPLAALVTPDLFGDCNVTAAVAAAADVCPSALTQPLCEAKSGCDWLSPPGACVLSSGLLEDVVLQPVDTWVSLLSNASAVCAAVTNASACAVANSTIAPPRLPSAAAVGNATGSLVSSLVGALRDAAAAAAAAAADAAQKAGDAAAAAATELGQQTGVTNSGGDSGAAAGGAPLSLAALLGGVIAAAVLPRLAARV